MHRILLISILTACGNAGQVRYFANKEIEDMTVGFQLKVGVPLDRSIEITILDDINEDKTAVGVCITSTDEEPKVKLLRKFWDEANIYGKRQVLFHELGHCFLDLDHDETILPAGVPKSLMYPTTIPEYIYQNWEEYYIYEIKTKNNLKLLEPSADKTYIN